MTITVMTRSIHKNFHLACHRFHKHKVTSNLVGGGSNTSSIKHTNHYNNTNNQRCLSSTSNSYQYPLHTETPVITRTKAPSDPHILDSTTTTTTNPTTTSTQSSSPTTAATTTTTTKKKQYPPPGQTDYFDDTNTLTPSDRATIRASPRPTNLQPTPLHGPILSTAPSYLPPPNQSRTALSRPQTEITTLANGLRVASQETYGQVCTFGIVSGCGSRLETDGGGTETNNTPSTAGTNHLLELLAFGGTTQRPDLLDVGTAFESLGGTSFANASREQFLYCVDVLRPNVTEAMGLLRDVVLYPKLGDADVEHAKKVVEYQWMDMVPEVRLGEALQAAAYQPLEAEGKLQQQQQLGRPHFCPPETVQHLTADGLRQFRNEHLLNPQRMVVAGAGIQHDALVELAETNFGHLTPPEEETTTTTSSSTIVPSVYTGGDVRQTVPTPDGFTRVALAFPILGWTSTQEVLAACVLQTLLGGGNSFSAGGPGKGMYSRLYRQVLNRYHWAESCEAFTSFHDEAGLIGIGGSAIPQRGGDVARVLAEHFRMLEMDVVDDEEFDRARNMLKCNVLTQLESRLVLFEDVGRQILTYDRREGTEEMCKKIDAVTKEDLRDLVRKALGSDGKRNAPTLSVVGDRVDYVPSHEEVKSWFEL